VHEAMHLQLSLIEKVVPLINSNGQKFYSPWKDEYRNSTGILHALYVFQVLNSFFWELLNYDLLSFENDDYLSKRRTSIAQQVSEVQDFVDCSDLTILGKHFTAGLMAKSKTINIHDSVKNLLPLN
jgi:HEXXH motif-containing protein